MPLTGKAIARAVEAGRITISPFVHDHLNADAYHVHLGHDVVTYAAPALDARHAPEAIAAEIPPDGLVVQPGRIYLARTAEIIGSPHYAMTLEAELAISNVGLWIEYSAPLGHVGARIPWTLELAAVHPVTIYPGMPIGRVMFWEPVGALASYQGRYADSTGIVASKLAEG